MILAIAAVVAGFALLLWSADRFVDGSAATARLLGMPPLLIGMVIVGFGTSAPEMLVSAIAAYDHKPELALGNALGSNIVNIGLILGVTALLSPIAVRSRVVRVELPLLLGVSLLTGLLLYDNEISRMDATILLACFCLLMAWTVITSLRQREDHLAEEVAHQSSGHAASLGRALGSLGVGLALLLLSSRIVVWGAVNVAQALGISDLIIGLTVVALGTSLPELAASISAVRKGEHDIAVGNVVGSNLFNLLVVVGIAGLIAPMSQLSDALWSRDWLSMTALTALLLVVAFAYRSDGRINRLEGALLLTAYLAYTTYLIVQASHT